MGTGQDDQVDAELAACVLRHGQDYAFVVLSADGVILRWSQGAERMTGYTASEAIGQQFSFLFLPSDRAAGQDRRELELALNDGRAEDTRWHIRKSGERFWANGVTTAIPGGERQLLKIIRDETRTRLADEQRVLLLNELNHRINNTLTIVQSMVEQTLRINDVPEALRESLSERLMALSRAHRTLVEKNWAGADLETIIGRAILPYEQPSSPRVHVDGPTVLLSPRQAVSLTLLLHELVTNAVKYGALSRVEGRVDVSWNLFVDELGRRHLTLLWRETGGPEVAAPKRSGFGTRLIERSFADYGGEVRTEFRPGGVHVTLATLLDQPHPDQMFDLSESITPAP
jgi:PAS domain S-box-containing protein